MKIIDYKIAYSTEPAYCAHEVQLYIKEGWQPYGSCFERYGGQVCQPMVKYGPEPTTTSSGVYFTEAVADAMRNK